MRTDECDKQEQELHQQACEDAELLKNDPDYERFLNEVNNEVDENHKPRMD